MSKKNSSQIKSAAGLTTVESVGDIPAALLECESEVETFAKELQLVADKYPDLAPVFKVIVGRTDIMLERLVACRSVL